MWWSATLPPQAITAGSRSVTDLIVLARKPFSDLDLDLAQVQSHVGTRGRIDDPVRECVRNPCPITRLWRKTLPPLGSIGDLRNALEGAVDRPIDDPGAVPEDESKLARSGQGALAPFLIGHRFESLLEHVE